MTDAHSQVEHLTLQYNYPAHEPRESDPHYHYFHAAVKRIKAAGKYKCWIDNADCNGPLQAHHSLVEFSLINDVSVDRFTELYPEFGVIDDESFFRFVEEEGNLTILCQAHHVGPFGVHVIPYPMWVVQRMLKRGVVAPARKLPNSQPQQPLPGV